ncbi:MAG: PspA/IM30 family protein [Spirochaetes bacterium]|nr:PspA/IM30 family protein [Spirochaetota bacterium]
MGIFDRFRRLIKSNLNEMINRSENPEKMLEQVIDDMNKQLIESKKSVASAIADEKKLERQINQTRAQSAQWEQRAETAVRAGEDELAKEALLRKQELDGHAEEYEKQRAQQHDSVEKLKVALRALQQKLEEAQRKRNLLVARARRVETQKKLNETIGGMNDTSAFEAFDRMTEKMDELEAQNEAMEELEDTSSKDELEDKFRKLEGSASDGDSLLSDLKKRLEIEHQKGAESGGTDESGNVDDSGTASNDAEGEESIEELKRRLREDEGKRR